MGRQLLISSLVAALVSMATSLATYYLLTPRLPVPTVEVPPIVGLSPEQARGLLEPHGLLLVIDGEKIDGTMSPGSVASQQPLGGSRFRRGDLVHAVLAKAPNLVKVPTITGMTVDAARAALQTATLAVTKTVDSPSSAPKGEVIGSTPPAGSDVAPNTPVEVLVSQGPATEPVPKVLGKRLSTAKEILTKAGFVVGAVRTGSHDDYEQGAVINQSPAAETPAAPGSKVDLIVND